METEEIKQKGKNIRLVGPLHGPNSYFGLWRKIEDEGLRRPTMAETASLAYKALIVGFENYNFCKIISKLTQHSEKLMSFTGVLYISNEGAYIQDDPEIRDDPEVKEGWTFKKRVHMEKSDLVKKLEQNDPSVRFVPFGFKSGFQTPEELEKNAFVIALAGEEGASKLAKVSKTFPKKPYLGTIDFKISEPMVAVTQLSSSRKYPSMENWGEWFDILAYDMGIVQCNFALGKI